MRRARSTNFASKKAMFHPPKASSRNMPEMKASTRSVSVSVTIVPPTAMLTLRLRDTP